MAGVTVWILATGLSHGQEGIAFDIERLMGEESVRLSWSTAPRGVLLERSRLAGESGWSVVPMVPVLQDGRHVLDLTIDADPDFFRLGTGTIIFVDADHDRPGTGTVFDPFQTITLGIEEAKIRHAESGESQTLYVFSKDYGEVIEIDGEAMPEFSVFIVSSRVPLTFGTQVFGGDERARLLAPAGQSAVNVRCCAGFRLVGFEIVATNATGFSGNEVQQLTTSDCIVEGSSGQHGVQLADIADGAVNFHGITCSDSRQSGLSIENFSGEFSLRDGDDDTDEDVLTINGTANGFPGINIVNSNMGTFTLASVDIQNVGAEGARLSHAGTVRFSAASPELGDEIGTTLISGTKGDAIHSVNTNLIVTFARIGETGPIEGDVIEITNNDGETRTADVIFNNGFGLGGPDPTGCGVFIKTESGTLFANLNANFFATDQTTISTVSGPAPRTLILDMTGNSTLTTNLKQPTMSVVGGGLHSTVVRAWDFPNQIIGGITESSGVLFDRVTFDADGDPSNGIQQVVFSDGPMDDGALDIGQVPPFTIQRIEGNGLTFINATGDLRIDTLNIANQNGTGLRVDKSLGLPFNVDIGGGTIDTVSGVDRMVDP